MTETARFSWDAMLGGALVDAGEVTHEWTLLAKTGTTERVGILGIERQVELDLLGIAAKVFKTLGVDPTATDVEVELPPFRVTIELLEAAT